MRYCLTINTPLSGLFRNSSLWQRAGHGNVSKTYLYYHYFLLSRLSHLIQKKWGLTTLVGDLDWAPRSQLCVSARGIVFVNWAMAVSCYFLSIILAPSAQESWFLKLQVQETVLSSCSCFNTMLKCAGNETTGWWAKVSVEKIVLGQGDAKGLNQCDESQEKERKRKQKTTRKYVANSLRVVDWATIVT